MKKDTNHNCLYKTLVIAILVSLLLWFLGFTIDKYLRNIIREGATLGIYNYHGGCSIPVQTE